MGFLWGQNEKFLKLTVAMVAQLCECTESHGILHFKWVNYAVGESQFNRAVFFFLKNDLQTVQTLPFGERGNNGESRAAGQKERVRVS